MSTLTFDNPWWFALLALAVPLAVIGLRWFVSMGVWRRWSAVLLRSVLVALVASMLAGAAAVRPADRFGVVFVIDVSGSVRRFAAPIAQEEELVDPLRAAQLMLERLSGGRGPDDLLGVIAFDGQSMAIATPSTAPVGGRSIDVSSREGTDIETALRQAAALIPPDAAGRIVLISDGNETVGDALSAANDLAGGSVATRSVPIDVVPLGYRVGAEVVIRSVDAPPRAQADSVVSVRATLMASAPTTGTVFLMHEDEAVDLNGDQAGAGLRVALEEGANVVRLSAPLPPGRVHRFEVVYEPDVEGGVFIGDTYMENNRGSAFTITPGRGAVLLVTAGGAANVLADTLRSSGIDVETVAPSGVPDDLLALQAYDLVMLDNIPAEALSERQHELLAAHVYDAGAGLVMIGGHESFGAGGWKGTAIEEILPVRLDLPEQLVSPAAAVIFVIDRSGSMSRYVGGSSRRQQQIANESTALAIRSMDQQDLVGVIAFNTGADVVVPLGPNDDPRRAAEAVLSIGSGGGTDLLPALREARAQMLTCDAKLKQVIVLSDGASMNGGVLPALAAQMNADGIRIATIAVGDQADAELLSAIAVAGGGAFYKVTNPSMLPRIFMRAVRVIREPLIKEGRFTPTVLGAGSPIMAGLGDPPPLGGLVLTRAREEPTVTYAMIAPGGEPVLAHWNVGLGKVAAFTSDADEWAEEWLDWPGYKRFWTQLAQHTARASTESNAELRSRVEGDTLRLTLDAYDDEGLPLEMLSVPATVYGPGGRTVEIMLSQTGPGRYEGQTRADASGSYIVVARPRLGGARLPPTVGGVSVASGREYRDLTSNIELLRRIADASGGVVRTFDATVEELFDRASAPRREVVRPIWRTLLVWTVLVLLLDIGTRRIAWDRYFAREYGSQFMKGARAGTAQRGDSAAAMLAGLRSREVVEVLRTPTLGDADAKVEIMAAKKRRKEARRAKHEAMRTGGPEIIEEPSEPEQHEDGASGLLAAKRRAQRRFEEDDL